MNAEEAFGRASDDFLEGARQVDSSQWAASTPCTEWNVRELVNHVAGEWLWVPDLMAGKTVEDVGNRFDGDVLGNDPVATVSAAQREAVAAFIAPSALERTVHLSFGDVPGRAYAEQMAVDTIVHAWDLARSIGGDERLDPELVDYAYAYFGEHAEEWRASGALQAAKEPVDDSTQAKLIALTGR
ncbi:MAG: TIGR03086 family protein [Candidatus Dormibacteraeota bacterium]|nr:TIGR03086 family protein [Candidatus Dormibacteraeota bacterium]